jgi:hypothetical protein
MKPAYCIGYLLENDLLGCVAKIFFELYVFAYGSHSKLVPY